MPPFFGMGKMLLYLGIAISVFGGLLMLLGKAPGFRLPGDIFVQKGNFSFYFPLASSILLSILLTIILNLISRR
ncbi:conserved hypothetical protein [Desulfofarcimen acetoxidans DSM 771]|jgi:hypothetical protein|uniref:DUF2905 domain-containing protein n=1 Tax=Desulfofarcimen acetoxidans (strain ATCC 49208 / DSM 771 / KCTC 5769 / VKM B-1644 / 5575) TaxID=485916 RepID=C8W4D5_DESAS|nr:DUF2905 domain-containing protein [Desulfofarcimen acetoxidans]ACV62003.1 conserved hypothetical protein [Desulfofarcimen acetoxidans DSM 771]